ncbi:phage head closure protein [Enterococcus faecalis]|uniref:phage head closure protein n=1 Tax=Enterococcus faecalis TaxID=1351 RepID=UPI0022E10242|nr:phage head closure protein [Enterococcus faecalis]
MARFVNTGDLNERISFIKKENGKNNFGENIVVEETVHECYSCVQEQFLSDVKSTIGTVLEDTTTFIIRYQQREKVTRTMRIKWREQEYEIKKINSDPRKRQFTTIIAKAVE